MNLGYHLAFRCLPSNLGVTKRCHFFDARKELLWKLPCAGQRQNVWRRLQTITTFIHASLSHSRSEAGPFLGCRDVDACVFVERYLVRDVVEFRLPWLACQVVAETGAICGFPEQLSLEWQ